MSDDDAAGAPEHPKCPMCGCNLLPGAHGNEHCAGDCTPDMD